MKSRESGAVSSDRRGALRRLSRLVATSCGWGSGLGLALGAGGQAVLAQPVFRTNPFSLGVASGCPDHQSVVLWTRLHDRGLFGSNNLPQADIAVRWEVSADERFSRVLATGQTTALRELAHSVHVEPQGLPADTVLFYRFLSGNAESPVGRTRTLPAPGAEVPRWRLALASCQHFEQGWFGAWRHLVADEPDLILFLGDYIYEYPPGRDTVRTVEGQWCLTLDDYRARYATYRQDADLQAAHRAAPWCMVWDDHEVQNDYAGRQAGNRGPEVEDFMARRVAAYQAYYEHMPLRASSLLGGLRSLQTSGELRIYGQHHIGRLIHLSMLDNRQYRDPQVCNPDGGRGGSAIDRRACSALGEGPRSLLGHAQEQWFLEQTRSAASQWHVVANATLFGQRLHGAAASPRVSNDGWDGYPLARQRLVDHFAQVGPRNWVVLGGDIHENWIGHILLDYDDPRSPPVGVEFCVGSVSSYASNAAALPARRRLNPHFVYGDSGVRGYGLVDFTSTEVLMQVRALDDHRKRDPSIRTAAAFKARRGQARLDPVQG